MFCFSLNPLLSQSWSAMCNKICEKPFVRFNSLFWSTGSVPYVTLAVTVHATLLHLYLLHPPNSLHLTFPQQHRALLCAVASGLTYSTVCMLAAYATPQPPFPSQEFTTGCNKIYVRPLLLLSPFASFP